LLNVALLLDVENPDEVGGDFPLRLSRKMMPVPKAGAAQFLLQVKKTRVMLCYHGMLNRNQNSLELKHKGE